MLSSLKISNFALIDSLETDFPDGFISVTGETGAGKSIILGALGLLSGGRADTKTLRNDKEKAVIEATFKTPSSALKPFFEENSLDWDESELILRREITPSGRSRAFINDTPVTLQTLSNISPLLIDIHSQHNNLLLRDPRHQRMIIDSYGDYDDLLNDCDADFRRFIKLHSRLVKLKKESDGLKQNKELLTLQLARLDKLNLKKGEIAELEQTSQFLSEAEEIHSALSMAYDSLEGAETNALSLLTESANALNAANLSLIENTEPSIPSRIEAVSIELKDICYTLRTLLSKAESDPVLLEKTDNRIRAVYETAKYFQTTDPESLVVKHNELKNQLASIESGSPELKELEKEASVLAAKLHNTAAEISLKRKECAEKFSRRIMEICRPLGLPNLRFEVKFTKGKIGAEGQDNIEFLCAFNKNQEPLPLAKAASGGEISRIMLAVKALVAERIQLPTMIFDEVDSGVSGEVAAKIGSLMRDLASSMQIITVTHLPQVAAAGTSQFHVFKEDNDNHTLTHIRRLAGDDRVNEIARLLSGDTINDAAILNARELLHLNS